MDLTQVSFHVYSITCQTGNLLWRYLSVEPSKKSNIRNKILNKIYQTVSNEQMDFLKLSNVPRVQSKQHGSN